ncbi:unnamed protein product [Gongylonema pulchrum]|uniref:Uncharacterized protein n=1 Tax=Gongylonema pulchrum TaxID=637853 RepID=A0A3P6QWP4_9BILA|nr:unnamed protein product [Gongylonema pulchrum]
MISQTVLRKYIMYARENATGSVAITVRHVESLIRLAEAHAKMHLRSYVCDEDVDVAVRVILESFISTQKASIMRQMRRNFDRHLNFNRDHNELLLYLLKQLVKDQLHYERARHADEALTTVAVAESDFIEKVSFLFRFPLKTRFASCVEMNFTA